MNALARGIRTPKLRRPDDTLRFGLMWPNSPSPFATSAAVAERNPDILDPSAHIALAKAAERAGVDFVFFADGYTNHGEHNARVGHGEPCISAPIWAPVVMTATEHIGVVTTMHARYLSPVVLARLGANLDVLSGGRWGWNIVPGAKGSEEKLFGDLPSLEHDERYEHIAETLDAVRALWASHGSAVDFDGRFHHLHGTPRGPFPVQEQPLIFNAGVSPAGRAFIGSHADYAFFAVVEDLEVVKKVVADLALAESAAGRRPNTVGGVGTVGLVMGATDEEAAEKFEWIRDSIDMDAARGWAKGFLGVSQTYQGQFGADLDEAARKIALSAGSRVLVGSAPSIAEQLIEIHRATGLRGYMLASLLWDAAEIEPLAEVFAILERAGVWLPPARRDWSW